MEDVKTIKKIDIHAHAVAFREYYPPRMKGNPDSVFVSAEQSMQSKEYSVRL